MSYNWVSASTPQGRERLKELMDQGWTVIGRYGGIITEFWKEVDSHLLSYYQISHECIYWQEFDTAACWQIIYFLDPNPSPEPNDDAPEGYHVVTFTKDQEKDENGLLPCPFCGGKGNVYRENEVIANHKIVCVFCKCSPLAISNYTITKAEAIAAWNRRAGKETNP